MEESSITQTEALRRLEELKPAFELGHAYARVDRKTIMPDGKFETDGEHAVSLAMIAVAYATKYHPELDPYKVAFYALFHDIDEFLHGDESSLGATHESYAKKITREREGAEARKRLLADFPEFLRLLEEMEDLNVPESAYGKAFDKLSPGYTHEANGGRALIEFYNIRTYEGIVEAAAVVDEKMYDYAAHLVDVIALRQATHRRVANIAFGHPIWVDEPLFEL